MSGRMINNFTTWPHFWFGCWSEFGEHYIDCPSIQDFVDKAWHYPNVDSMVTYLTIAPIVATTSRMAIPWATGSGDGRSSISYRTDGIWLWLDDLDYYVLHHHVRLPDSFVKHMENINYKAPQITLDMERLPWPPIR